MENKHKIGKYIIPLLIIFTLFVIDCKKEKKQPIVTLLGAPSSVSTVPSDLIFSGNPFTFIQATPITKIMPSVSGTVTSCFASPTLPTGLSIDKTTCAISGTPTTLQAASDYAIIATNSAGSRFTTISISVASNAGSTTSTSTCTGTSVPNPAISLASGVYTTLQTIAFTSVNGGQVRCTTDGSEPTASSTLYSSANVYQLAGLTVKCKNFLNGVCSDTVTREYSYPPIKTGQTTVYQTGDNGTNQTGLARSYTNNGDGTVTDNYSGLLWQKCSIGLSGASCENGTATIGTWVDHGTYCSGLSLAGKTWRLPTVNELSDLVDFTSYSPTINATNFPATNGSYYWSSNTVFIYGTTSSAWLVSFFSGNEEFYSKTTYNAFGRCVSGQSNNTLSFVDNNDGTVRDKKTNLVWQKCSAGLNNDSTCSGTIVQYTWTNAISYCSGLSLAGKAWRLPTINELRSIVDYSRTLPSINISFFPATSDTRYYWSSTSFIGNPILAWVLNFREGYTYSNEIIKTGNNFVRCVSGP